MELVSEFLSMAKASMNSEQYELIERTVQFSREAHEGQFRQSGEPYIVHPVNVAMILLELGMDADTVSAAILHDVIEDTTFSYEEIAAMFGESIAKLVDGVTKLARLDSFSKEEQQAESLRKMFVAMANDIRVIMIKLADRLHNMRTLSYMEPVKQKRIARETLEIYAPLAHRLGIYAFKGELEDLSLLYLEPEQYEAIKERLEALSEERGHILVEVMDTIGETLRESNIYAEIEGRPKTIYSIYKKMTDQGRPFEEIHDLSAVRVIVNTVKDCYTVLGILHTMYKPLPGRFKDYIAVPTQNMYQSLHTTCLGRAGTPFEVQIRTFEMHRTAEYGIAAHWKYKEKRAIETDLDSKLTWLRQLLEWQNDMKDAKEFMDSLRIDLFTDDVLVFTPKGDVVDLIKGATPLDFAYAIHSAVGNNCVGAKVNSRLVPLSFQLSTGDIVEILTSKNSGGPSRDWLNIVKTSQAKNKIKQWFKREFREENIVKGKDMLEYAARRQGFSLPQLLKTDWLEPLYKKYTLNSIEDLYAAIGYGGVTTGHVLTRLIDDYRAANKLEEHKDEGHKRAPKTESHGVIVKGEADMLVRFAKCCNPLPGDDIVGYITRGRGVSVHQRSCENIGDLEDFEHRAVEVTWAKAKERSYHAEIEVLASDRAGLLLEITQLLAGMNLSMSTVNARVTKNRTAIINFSVEVGDAQQLDRIIKYIRNLPEVSKVFRSHA